PLDIDPNLKGGTVRVEYKIGPNGRVEPGSIRMVASPRATATDIGLHAETARTLHAYAGLLGSAHEAIQKLRRLLQGQRAPEQGSAAWEAQMELAKLDGMLRSRMKSTAGGVVDEARAVQVAEDIANLRAQLAEAQRILEGFDPADPRGFIAAEGVEQRRERIAATNRQVVATNNIGRITIRKGVVGVQEPGSGKASADPAAGYHFSGTPPDLVLSRNPSAGDAPLLMLVEHRGRLYIAPQPSADSQITRAVHANNIRAQLDGYPPPRPGQNWSPDGDGWQHWGKDSDGRAMRIVKDNGKPVQNADGSFRYVEQPDRPSFDDRKASAVANQPAPELRSAALETALDNQKVGKAEADRAILRRWSDTLAELGRIGETSQGMNLPTEPELAHRAATALAKGIEPDGSYIEPRYDDFRYVLRDAALAAILGFDADTVDKFVRNGTPLPHEARDPARQRELYDKLYAALPDSQSKGELWSRYRELRGRLPAEKGGFGDFERIPIPTHLLQNEPKTLIDGGIRVPEALGPDLPPAGNYALESKGGGSYSREQAGRYSDNLKRNGDKLVGDGGESYAGVVYLFDNLKSATTAANSLSSEGRHAKIFVAYVDDKGQVKWIRRRTPPKGTKP
ncbi:MAG TPA: hypothetical protein VIL69_04230, partial [Roseomonas sp.]